LREVTRAAGSLWRSETLPASPRIVVTVPGLGANDASLAPLRTRLRRDGHHTHGWGQGLNTGDVEQSVSRTAELVTTLAAAHDEQVILVGWSLGGLIAREVARDRPHLVERVITFGTPLEGPRYTSVSWLYGADRTAEIESSIVERRTVPIGVPITAIYSTRDGIVDWRSCIDRHNTDVEHLEVSSSHLGMSLDPDVWQIVADRLAGGRDR
jgi:pimeloyl-ACP methyl ester carboxylesterase